MSVFRRTKKTTGIAAGLLITALFLARAGHLRAGEGCDASEDVTEAIVNTVYDPSDDLHRR